MILICHLVIGAIIASQTTSIFWIVFLAIVSHYILDTIPHIEYMSLPAEGIREANWLRLAFETSKVLADAIIGVALIFTIWRITLSNPTNLALGGFFGIFPDILTGLFFIFPNSKILKKHRAFHEKVHFLQKKKYPLYFRIFTQVAVVLLGFIFLTQR